MQISGGGKGSLYGEKQRLLSKMLVSHSDHALPNAVTVLFCHCCSGWGCKMSGNVSGCYKK